MNNDCSLQGKSINFNNISSLHTILLHILSISKQWYGRDLNPGYLDKRQSLHPEDHGRSHGFAHDNFVNSSETQMGQ